MLDPDRYDDVAEAFDRYAERTVFPVTECLMEMTGARAGHVLLDVACGSGIVSRRAAAIVGPTGRTVGIDLSPGQIRVAAERARALGHHWSEFRVMDAMRLELADASFDVVVAQFPHFPDRARCIAEMFRVLKPGGAFAIANGGGGAPRWPLANAPEPSPVPPEAALDGLFAACLEERFPELAGATAGFAPGPRPPVEEELRQAGFAGIQRWSYSYLAPFTSVAEVLEFQCLSTSRYRMARSRLDPTRVRAFEAEYHRRAAPILARFGVVGLTSGALFGVGTRPPAGERQDAGARQTIPEPATEAHDGRVQGGADHA